MTAVQITLLVCVESVGLFMIAQLWASKRKTSLSKKVGWSVLLLIPLFGPILFRLLKPRTGPKAGCDMAPRRIGKCIYCGSVDDLTTEHIIPKGLAGGWTLNEASCRRCAAITSAFERDVLRNLWGPARTALGFRSRSGHLSKYSIVLVGDGVKKTVVVDPRIFGVLLLFPRFEAPAYLSGKAYSAGITAKDHTAYSLPSLQHLAQSIKAGFNPKRAELSTSYSPIAFARFLAKVAYGFTVLKLGLENIKKAYVIEAILGRTNDIGKWVGCNADGAELSKGTLDWEIRINFINTPQRDILVEIKLFSKLETPTYLVVVGEPQPQVLRGVTFDSRANPVT